MSPPTPQSTPTRRIAELDGLRGISVLLVVYSHMANNTGYVTLSDRAHSMAGYWGESGVQIFFVISGFVITMLLIAEHQRTGRISLRGFYTRRFFRIIPAYWTYSFAVMILAFFGILILKQEGVPHITSFLVSSLFLSDIICPNWFWKHTWSLSVEEQFYIFFPLIFRTIFKSLHRATIMAVFLGLVYVSAFFDGPIIELLFRIAYRINSHMNWHRNLQPGGFFDYNYIAVGVFMAIYWDSVSTALRRLPGFFYVFLVMLFVSWPLVSQAGILAYFLPYLRPLALGTIVGWTMIHPGYFGFLRWQVTQLIGACSYSIYMWQQMFTADPDHYGPWYPRGLFIALVLLFACAGLSYFVIERNFILLGRRLTADSSRGHPPATVAVGFSP